MDLRGAFLGLQRTMIATLETNRAAIGHTITQGAANELQWVATLKKYLPERYCVDSGFVVDSEGTVSQQIDVVIYDRHYSPFLFHEAGAKYVPAESVYAVFEIKQLLTARDIVYAGKKAASVRRLLRTSAAIPHAWRSVPAERAATHLGGVLGLEEQMETGLRQGISEFPGVAACPSAPGPWLRLEGRRF